MPIAIFDKGTRLTQDFFSTHGNKLFAWGCFKPEELDNKRFNEHYSPNHNGTASRVCNRIVLIPNEVEVAVHVLGIIDIAGEFKVQQKFNKSKDLEIYKGLLHDDGSIFIYRKIIYRPQEKGIEDECVI